MKSHRTLGGSHHRSDAGSKQFTLDEANRALVFVRPVVQDIVKQYEQLMQLRQEREVLSTQGGNEAHLSELQARIEAILTELARLNDELALVGCALKDWSSGLIDFPARHAGRDIWLCWRLGEEQITHWHEWESGFGGRRPIDAQFTTE